MTSTIKVNTITTESGSTLTLGESGKTVTLASGASQTGFGRTGTVDWQTGSIKTATFTAVSGEGYFCNTAGGAFEVDLPAGSAGAIVSVQDYNNTFDSNALTVDPNGSEKINGGSAGDPVTLDTEGQGVTFVYIDATVGWRSVQDNQFSQTGSNAQFISATGGTVTTVDTNFKVHTFTGPGTFTVCSVGNACGSNTVSYMVVAGGGSGGMDNSGGGGGGGFREGLGSNDSYTGSPLRAGTGVPVTATSFPIVVGAGGAAVTSCSTKGNDGNNSSFSTITSAKGGAGGAYPGSTPTSGNGNTGGSGGGAQIGPSPGTTVSGAAGNTPPVSPPQGNPGGASNYTGAGNSGGGGGGATAAGGNSGASPSPGQQAGGGGTGATTSITGSSVGYAGGGGGGAGASCLGGNGSSCLSGSYGGGNSGKPAGGRTGAPPSEASENAGSAAANKGGGGGGANNDPGGSGAGGSGIVVIRYKFQ